MKLTLHWLCIRRAHVITQFTSITASTRLMRYCRFTVATASVAAAAAVLVVESRVRTKLAFNGCCNIYAFEHSIHIWKIYSMQSV